MASASATRRSEFERQQPPRHGLRPRTRTPPARSARCCERNPVDRRAYGRAPLCTPILGKAGRAARLAVYRISHTIGIVRVLKGNRGGFHSSAGSAFHLIGGARKALPIA